MLEKLLNAIAFCLRRFGSDKRGNIAILFGLSSTALVVAAGAGIDLSRAYTARQKLSEAAALTCQYSVAPSIVETATSTSTATGGFATYVNAVNTYATKSLARVNWTGPQPTPVNLYFSATPAVAGATGTAAAAAPTSPAVEMYASVPTYFMQIVHINQIPVHTKINCLTASTAPKKDNINPQEGFENVTAATCPGYCFIRPDGSYGVQASPTSSTPSAPSYIGVNGQQWYILGYCLEIDTTGVINSTSPEGSHTAELDCDNGNGSAGNSSITTKIYFAPGYYELRYNYRARIDYPNYDPTYICGSTAADVGWANDTTTSRGTASRTNQINVYFDIMNTATIPTHATIDGTQQLGGVNLIDMCVYSPTWIERSVKIHVSTPGYYWLSFAADGASDSYGGQLDNIRVCQDTCAGTPQDNFPASWLAASNGGVSKVLFEDTFENPAYTQDPYVSSAHTKGGNMANSLGKTSTSTCNVFVKSPPGWPCQTATGWATAPYNEVVYWEQGSSQGTQYISLQGWNPTTSSDISAYGYTNSGDPINRAISRKFLLDPGYYSVSYNYTSMIDFSTTIGLYGTYCFAAPASGNIYATNTFSPLTGNMRYGSTYSVAPSTNIVGVFMSNGQLISTPNINSTLGGAVTYTNTDGSVTSTPAFAPDTVTWYNYNASAANPVIDTCGYSAGFAWVPRTVNVKITKPGLYWLTFSASGDPLTGAGSGPAIDDVKLTALGSPYMTSPPTSALTAIPVPDPQPDTIYSGPSGGAFNGFYIVADPFSPTAADL